MKESKEKNKPILLKLHKIVLNNWKKFFWGIVFFSVLSLLAGGWVFYYYYKFPDNVWFCVGMTLQNCVETLLFNPVLPIQDIVEEKDFINNLRGIEYAAIVMYKIAMVVVPLIEVLAIFSILNYFLHLFVGWTPEKQKILIVGYNDRVRKLLNRGDSEAKIYLWTDKFLSEEEKKSLFLKNIMVETEKYQISNNSKDEKETIEKYNKFLKDNDITDVLLLDESDFHNMEYYMALSSCIICKEKTINFFVLNKEFEMRNMLQDYFDCKLDKMSNAKDTHMNLRIFNFQQIQAEKLFSKLPLFFDESVQGNPDNSDNPHHDIHLLIVGDGDICEQILLHAMNQGVITPENNILIDVINENTTSIEKRLKDRFNLDYVKHNNGTFRISSPESDGKLVIRLSSCNFEDESFTEQVKKNCSPEKYTYFVFCLASPEMNLHCMLQLKKYKKSISSENTSVAVRITDTIENENFIRDLFLNSGDGLYLMGADGEKTGIHQIINLEEEEEIRKYHVNYSVASGNSENNPKKDSPDVLWNKEKYYKRESNRALYFYQNAKKNFYKSLKDKDKETYDKKKAAYDKGIEAFLSGSNGLDNTKLSNRLIETTDKNVAKYPELLKIAKTEHRRFTYFYASMGWGYNEDKKIEKEKLHDCLCEWNKLVKNRQELLIYDLVSNNDIFKEK